MGSSMPNLSTGTTSTGTSTTKDSSSTTTASSNKSTSTGSTSKLPKLSSTTTSASTSSSSYATPTITPPSAEDNPYIWKSNTPSGTVFIAVGAVAGFIFLSFILVLFIKKLMAKRTAKHTLSLDSESGGSPGMRAEKINNPFYATSTNPSTIKIPLLYEQPEKSFSDINDTLMKPEQNLFSTLDNDPNKRRSMFISPTAEVMNYNKSNSKILSHNMENNSISVSGSIPDFRHGRTNSYDYQDVGLQSPERSPHRSPNRGHRTVPSQYLEAMFEEDND